MNWTSANRRIKARLLVQWGGTSWTDEAASLHAAHIAAPKPLRLDRPPHFPSGQATFTLKAGSDRFSPFNTASPLYAAIADNHGFGAALQFDIGLWNGTAYDYTRVFTGYIDRLTTDSIELNTATITAADAAQPYAAATRSTAIASDVDLGAWIAARAAAIGINTAQIGGGLHNVPYAWLDGEIVLDDLIEAARADGGILFFDKSGTLQFYNAERWLTEPSLTTSQHDFVLQNFQDAKIESDWTTVHAAIAATYAPRAAGASITLYEVPETITIPAGESIVITARHRAPALSIAAIDTTADIRIVTGAGVDMIADTSLLTTHYAQHSVITIGNNHAYHTAHLVKLTLYGVPILGTHNQTVIKLNTRTADRTLTLADNSYIQTAAQANFITAMFADRYADTAARFTVRSPLIPALDIHQRVTITDADSGLSQPAFVERIETHYGGGELYADYTLIDASNWFTHIGDYYHIGTSNAADDPKVFY